MLHPAAAIVSGNACEYQQEVVSLHRGILTAILLRYTASSDSINLKSHAEVSGPVLAFGMSVHCLRLRLKRC